MKGQPPQPLFHRHSEYCQKSPALFLRPGVGRAHKKQSLRCLSFDAKNLDRVYKQTSGGYTINRKNNRQQEIQGIDTPNLHIDHMFLKIINILTASQHILPGETHTGDILPGEPDIAPV